MRLDPLIFVLSVLPSSYGLAAIPTDVSACAANVEISNEIRTSKEWLIDGRRMQYLLSGSQERLVETKASISDRYPQALQSLLPLDRDAFLLLVEFDVLPGDPKETFNARAMCEVAKSYGVSLNGWQLLNGNELMAGRFDLKSK